MLLLVVGCILAVLFGAALMAISLVGGNPAPIKGNPAGGFTNEVSIVDPYTGSLKKRPRPVVC
jgi:hypothetical protein